MAADLITRIILDDKNFNDNLKKSKKTLESFDKIGGGVKNSLSSIVGVAKKFAAPLLAAASAGEAMNKVLRGSQTTSDALDANMRAVNTSVDAFFTSISTGDFSAFDKGISGIIARAKEANAALDQLGNTVISYDYFSSKNNVAFGEQINNARDKGKSKEERKAALDAAKAIYDKQMEYTNTLYSTALDATKKLVTETNGMLNADMVNQADIERVLELDVLSNRDEIKGRLAKEYSDLLEQRKKFIKQYTEDTIMPTTWGSTTVKSTDWEKVNDAMKPYIDSHKDAILFNEILVKKNDDWLKNLTSNMTKANSAMMSMVSMQKQMTRAGNPLVGTSVSTGKSVSPEGSIADLEKQISDMKAKLKVEVDPESRIKLYTEIKKLENQKHVIEFQFKHPHDPGKVERKKGGLADLADTSGMSEQLDQIFSKKKTKDISKYASSIQLVADSVSNLSNNFNSGASAGLQYFATVVSGAAQAAIAIAALIPVKEAESQANAKAAITGAAASQASIPFVGPMLAAAAVASLIAVMLAIPKFAKGGIVGGSSFAGDKILTRLNSGEMVLNTRQQGNLFNLLNGGGGTTNGGMVEFKIRGKDLVGTLNNYNKQRSKIL